MKNEETVFDNETTTLDESQLNVNKTIQTEEKKVEAAPEKKQRPLWQKAATGMGAGVLLGSVAAFAFTDVAHAAPNSDDDDSPVDDHNWADDSVSVATSVSDDMSFSQAFAAARAEVGPGGAFEWHGGVYGTYTADEWNNMTPEERDEFGNHFNWNNHHDSSADSSDDDESHLDVQPEEQLGEHLEEPIGEDAQEPTTDDIEVVSVDQEQPSILADSETPEIQDESVGISDPEVNVTVSMDEDVADVEILGVVHDDSGANIGGMMVDGQEVFLIDVDGSGSFDYVAADLNNDGQISADEYTDISDANITVDQLDNMLEEDVMYASNDGETDYVNDDVIA